MEAKKRVCLDATQIRKVTIIALGSLVPSLTPVSELAVTSALFTFKGQLIPKDSSINLDLTQLQLLESKVI